MLALLIFGQKRVGKTSIAKSLKKLMKPDTYLIAYIEGGEFISPDPIVTVNKLGTKLCQRIQAADLKLKNIPVPDFEEGAISPLVDFLDSVTDQINECKVIFILDEFDELPVQLFKRGPFGDSFFLTMRSLSGKSPFGFILVGGEKMEFIMSVQGDAINKFRAMRVDYFDRQNYWSDFQTLVRKPVENWFDISDKAINTLYSQTAGNPFYTKYICSNVFNLMVERRDSHITITEVNEAIDISIKEISSNSFQHFWEDGIFETSGDRVEEISIRRRKILLVLADLYRKDKPTDKEAITNHEILQVYSNEEVVNELNQFVRRQILIENKNYYEIKVGLLKLWLIKKGISEIMTTFSDYDSILKRKQIEEKSYVKSQEIIDAISSWGLYRGEKIGEERVRSWLNQFGENSKQRLMLTILKNVNFYTANRIREKMREAQGIVDREIKIVKSSRKRKRSDIIVSYIDKIGKSGGGIYAKLYADENNIYVDNIIEKDKIPSFLKNNSGTSALVFVDDFIGTGGSAKSYFTSMKDGLKKALINSGTKCYFITISGFQESKQELEILLERNKLPVTVHICDPIDDSFKCFSQNSRIFQDNDERNYAKSICYEFGSKIIKENFLGFGDCQTTIVFENNCPNNNLPILWAESEDPPWRPIFKRS